MQAGVIRGSDRFLEEIQEKIKAKSEQIEISRMQRHASRASLDEIFKTEAVGKTERDKWIYRNYVRNDYTMKEIADYLEVHYVTVSRAVKRKEN